MENVIMKKRNHTEEEKNWAKEKMEQFEKITGKTILENRLLEEYSRLFDKTLALQGMLSWFGYIRNPELKKKYTKSKKKRKMLKPQLNKKEKESEVFEKSTYLAYLNGRICGFEDKERLEIFMKENRILMEDVKVFKMLPVKVEYKVEIGE